MSEVEVKLKELRELIDGYWHKGDAKAALTGEHMIKAVEENIAATKILNQKARELSEVLK